jgi:hypothetical protein
MMLSLACVFVRVWSSIRRDVICLSEDRCYGLSKRLEWWRWLILSCHVVLKSAKDQILGVDTPGQQVPPCVRYGMACLLIMNDIGCVFCLVE